MTRTMLVLLGAGVLPGFLRGTRDSGNTREGAVINVTLAMLGAGIFLALAAPASAQDLGRLFLTPEQRETLDARRRARVPDKPVAAAVVQSPTTRFDGQVVRSSGRSTLWIGGQVVRDGAQPDGLSVSPSPRKPGQISVSPGEGGRPVDIKVGQTLNRDTHEVRDPVRDGAEPTAATAAGVAPPNAQARKDERETLPAPRPLTAPGVPGMPTVTK